MKTWKPDTCECHIEEVYNGNEIVGGGQVLSKCAAHASVPDEDLYGVLYSNPDGENKVKNMMHRILLGHEEVKDLGLEKVTKNNQGVDEVSFKEGVEYKWSFSGEGKHRKLQVEMKGINLSKAQKTLLKESADSRFGVGKVEIE